jgi:hypothetical protein
MTLPNHLAPVAGRWSVWRWVCLRGAGFPFTSVTDLAVNDALPALDDWLNAKAAEDEARGRGIAASTAQRASTGEGDPVGPMLDSVLERLRTKKVPKPHALYSEELTSALLALAGARERATASERAARARIDESERKAREALRDAAKEPRFREALLWQNRRALERGVGSLIGKPLDATDSKTRQNERLVASYLQRYCTKNDTIGFFGPVGWGRFVDDGAPIVYEPGRNLLETRSVYFEYWAIDEIARRIGRDPALRPWLKPRRSPSIRLEGRVLHHSIDRTDELQPEIARLLSLCDGTRTARSIARELIGEGDEDEVFELLEELAEKKLVMWELELPTPCTRPELALRQLLDEIGDEDAKRRALAVVDRLDERRAAVERAAGDPDALDREMASLERTFVESTGLEGTRRAGETYGGRTLVYEDCRREMTLRFGREPLDRLGPALGLMLDAARWMSHEVARRYRAVFDEAFERTRGDRSTVDYLVFRREAGPKLEMGGEGTAIFAGVAAELQSRWARILAVREDEKSRIQRSSRALADKAAAAFAAPCPGWPTARYHSPDLMIAAASAEAMAQGRYFGVLGELHYGTNTLLLPPLVEQHYDPNDLVRACDHDIPTPIVEPLRPREHVERANSRSYSARDLHLETGESRSWRSRDRVLAIGELVVERGANGHLAVRTTDGRFTFDVIELHDQYFGALCKTVDFNPLAHTDHTPRLTIDDLVISRERWVFPPEAIPFVNAKTRTDLIAEAHFWRHAHGVPRFVFMKIPEEEKPSFVDFASPVLVETFAKLVRGASAVALSEMLPSHDQLWLADPEGRHCTSELRIVAVDPIAWSPPS